MTINNPDLYMAGIWDWSILDGCFGETHIKPTDIDGLVERNECFLILETKQPGAQLPLGQERMFRALVKRAGAVVIVVWGERNRPERLRVFSQKHPDGKEIEDTKDGARLRLYVSAWFKRANERRAA